MIERYSPWAEVASIPDLIVEWTTELPAGQLGEYDHDYRLILLRKGMARRQARFVLCHELRHAEHGDVTTCLPHVNSRQETRADREAARLLIHLEDLRRAVAIHGHHRSAVAVELGVADEALAIRLEHMQPAERMALKRSA